MPWRRTEHDIGQGKCTVYIAKHTRRDWPPDSPPIAKFHRGCNASHSIVKVFIILVRRPGRPDSSCSTLNFSESFHPSPSLPFCLASWTRVAYAQTQEPSPRPSPRFCAVLWAASGRASAFLAGAIGHVTNAAFYNYLMEDPTECSTDDESASALSATRPISQAVAELEVYPRKSFWLLILEVQSSVRLVLFYTLLNLFP